MQKHLSLLTDVRGCMTRFDPLTPEIVAAQSEDGLTYDELKQVLEECGMNIEKVVFDGTRTFQNAFYADFEKGHYCWIPFQRANLLLMKSGLTCFTVGLPMMPLNGGTISPKKSIILMMIISVSADMM